MLVRLKILSVMIKRPRPALVASVRTLSNVQKHIVAAFILAET